MELLCYGLLGVDDVHDHFQLHLTAQDSHKKRQQE